LKTFIENGKQGTVLMSLGTNQRSDALGLEFIKTVLETFESIPEYNFLWKFESDNLPFAQPKNVMIAKFLPQNDILAHPNLKAFITHAGSFSTQESLWYGVPCVAMPFFLDQYNVNDNKFIARNFAIICIYFFRMQKI
jgi:UDP:flavonoid glycosyltransferase YjiC (YdhE family)